MNISELLDAYATSSSIFGARYCSVNQDRTELVAISNERVAARAAVDAAVKALQNRIAELEHFETGEQEPYGVANQLMGYVGPSTDRDLADFLIREGKEACKLADRIVELEKQRSYVYIGRDGKAVLARVLEDRLIAAEAEIEELKSRQITKRVLPYRQLIIEDNV